MRELILYRPEHGGSCHLNEVMDDMVKLASRRLKIYYTYVRLGPTRFILHTTSKDTYLKLGLFSENGLENLVNLFEEEFEKGKCNEMLVAEPDKNGGLVVTRMINDTKDIVTFHLSPAH